jgi:hypothetical protein
MENDTASEITDILEDELEDETAEERELRLSTEVVLDENSKLFIENLIDRLMLVSEQMSGHPFYEYQKPFARRFFESLILDDGATITALFSRQSGKSLDINTPMLTPDGWKTMKDVKVGDYVFAPDGNPVRVIACSEIFTDHDCYEITFADRQKIIADANHRWTLQDRKTKDIVTVNTSELYENEFYVNGSVNAYRYRLPLTAPIQMKYKDLPIDPYILGIWLGDGSSSKAEITTADSEILERFVEAGYELSYSDNRNTGKATTYGFRNGLYAGLKNLNLLKHTAQGLTGVKHVPEQYLLASFDQRLELLRGLMDSDGYCDRTRGCVEFCSKSRILAENVLFLARSFGWKVTMSEGRATIYGKDCGPKYRVTWQPYKELSPFSLARKTSSLKDRPTEEWRYNRTATVPIVSVELVSSIPVKCIAVDHPDHLYLAGRGLLPTHNTEVVANTVATAMVMLPRLAKVFPDLLGKYSEGVYVGAFAPVDEQADNLFGRIEARLRSETTERILADPEINEQIVGRGRTLVLKSCGSLVRKTTCHPRASIEGRTYHVILVDECQFADTFVINKSVSPMGASKNATTVFTGTPSYNKNIFYTSIQANKRNATKTGGRVNHFEIDWRSAAKENPLYKKYIAKEMRNLGEDSNEFKLSYRVKWLLEKGMFTTSERLDELGDKSMQSVVHAHNSTPVVAGIDCGRKQDRTVVTVVYVDWNNPDPFGFYHHHVLNWLDLEGMDWEEQYFRIVEFLSNYNVWKVGIDVGGLGDVVCQRLKILMPHTEIVELGTAQTEQSVRWKHLKQLIERGQISWPAGAKVRRLKVWRRFRQEMEDLEILFKGPNMLAEAPHVADAHDDYPDSLSMACVLTTLEEDNSGEVEVYSNVLYNRENRYR